MMKIMSILVACALALFVTGCAHQPLGAGKTYVLVHGAFQDKRAWDDLIPRLERSGAKVVAVDLPGRENGNTALEAATLDSYRDTVIGTIEQQSGPVILVGHSFGGITISNVAERVPERIKTLVYVAAYLPEAGAAEQSMAKLAEKDEWNKFNKARQNFILAKDYKSASVLAEDQIMLFCADCSDSAKEKTRAIMQREPLAPAATPVTTTAARYGSLAKVYIATTNDNAVSHTFQQRMMQKTSVRKVVTLATGHSPFLEAPDALSAALLSIE
jgi:pimeloyl-ACP methyl ester carboxylesterase